jgi:hypothetical protein
VQGIYYNKEKSKGCATERRLLVQTHVLCGRPHILSDFRTTITTIMAKKGKQKPRKESSSTVSSSQGGHDSATSSSSKSNVGPILKLSILESRAPERAAGHSAKDAYLQANDVHYVNFRQQLEVLGLRLRDIAGDGWVHLLPNAKHNSPCSC